MNTRPLKNETYYQRLERLGWEFAYRSYRKDAYVKRGWIVVVPDDIRIKEFYMKLQSR